MVTIDFKLAELYKTRKLWGSFAKIREKYVVEFAS